MKFDRLCDAKRVPRSRGLFELVRDAATRAFKKCGQDASTNMDAWRLSHFEVEAKMGAETMLSVKVVMSFWISHRRQSCTCERSLKAIVDQLKSKRKDVTLQWLNDALLLRRHGPQARSSVATVVPKGVPSCLNQLLGH